MRKPEPDMIRTLAAPQRTEHIHLGLRPPGRVDWQVIMKESADHAEAISSSCRLAPHAGAPQKLVVPTIDPPRSVLMQRMSALRRKTLPALRR